MCQLAVCPAAAKCEDTAAEDPLLLYFTSGTTGDPKMAVHTHVSYPLGHVATGKCVDLKFNLQFNLKVRFSLSLSLSLSLSPSLPLPLPLFCNSP